MAGESRSGRDRHGGAWRAPARRRAALAVDRGYTRARGDLSRAATVATDYVTANPGKTLLLAASAGFALGMLMRRRRAC